MVTVLCATKEFNDPVLQYLSDDFRAYDGSTNSRSSRSDFLDTHRNARLVNKNEKQPIEVGNVDLDLLRGKADIWVQCKLVDLHRGMRGEIVYKLSWERRKDSWMCIRSTNLSGVREWP